MKLSLLQLFFALLPLAANADAVEIDGIFYNLNPKGKVAEVAINPNKYEGVVEIPETVTYNDDVYNVTSIRFSAFSGCTGLTSVTIPNSVTSIGSNAFFGCFGLSSVTIPNSVTSIGNYAFAYCSNLTSIVIPNGTTEIEGGAFSFCTNLASVRLSESVSSIGLMTFEGCTVLNSIVVDPQNPRYDSRDNSNAIIETKTNTLIEGCINTTIPATITSINKYAFSSRGIKHITIPESIEKIGNNAFSGCNELREVVFSGVPKIKELEEATFFGCISLQSFEIPEGVISIGKECFSGCENLKSVYIPESVENIDYDAFYAYFGVRDFYINSIESWCNYSFSLIYDYNLYLNGKLLRELTIPSHMSKIKDFMFGNCMSLRTVILNEGVVSLGRDNFSYCENLSSVVLPQSIISLDVGTFCWCKLLRDFYCYAENVPETIESTIYGIAFRDTPLEKATLHVPASSVEAYKQTVPWSGFGNIVVLKDSDPKPTNVSRLIAGDNNNPLVFFTVDGRRSSKPQRGLNLVRMSNGTTKKVIVK